MELSFEKEYFVKIKSVEYFTYPSFDTYLSTVASNRILDYCFIDT